MPDAARFFEAIAGRYDRAYGLSTAESRARLSRLLRLLPPAPADILDLGVGTGREISRLLDAGYTPTGLDASPAMLAKCTLRARPIPLVLADFWRAPLPFEARAFDAAVALHGTLAHPPDADAVGALASELARVTRGGAVFVAEVPSPAWLDRIEQGSTPVEGHVVRTGPSTCLYEDDVTGASIATRLLDAAEWRSAFDGRSGWSCRVDPVGEVEWLVVARRD